MNRYDLQSYALLALNRLRRLGRPAQIPLFAPPSMLHTGGNAVSHLYKDIFVHRAYAALGGLRPGARILDAGAHIGLASMFFLHTYPDSTVIAVEANPTTAALLSRNLAPWRDRVRVVAQALTRHDGTTSFFVTTGTPTNVNAGIRNRERSDVAVTRLEIPCIDVASLLAAPIDFAKIDIEGAEYDVLMADGFVPEQVRQLVVEFHDIDQQRERFEAAVRTLTEVRGYRLLDLAGRPLSLPGLQALGAHADPVCRFVA